MFIILVVDLPKRW